MRALEMLIELGVPEALDVVDAVVEPHQIFLEFLPLLLFDLDEHVVGAILELCVKAELRFTLSLSSF